MKSIFIQGRSIFQLCSLTAECHMFFFYWRMPTEPPPPATFHSGSTWYGGRSTSSQLGIPCPSQQEKSLAVDRFFGGLQTSLPPNSLKERRLHPPHLYEKWYCCWFRNSALYKLSTSTGEPEFWTISNIGTRTCLFWFLGSHLENQAYHESHPHIMNVLSPSSHPKKWLLFCRAPQTRCHWLARSWIGAPEAERVPHDVFWGGRAAIVWISNGDVTKLASKHKLAGDVILAFFLPVSFGFFSACKNVLGKFSMLNKVLFFVSSWQSTPPIFHLKSVPPHKEDMCFFVFRSLRCVSGMVKACGIWGLNQRPVVAVILLMLQKSGVHHQGWCKTTSR